MKIKSYAKLNLNLNVLPDKLPSGFYKVHFINSQISLHDILDIKKASDINITCNKNNIPLDENNLVYKACQLLKVKANINIQKNIPMLGGLGGGSANAASTIYALKQIYNLKLSRKRIDRIANQLGKDVCYLVYGGLAEVSHDGSVIKKIPYNLPRIYLLIIYPRAIKPSTAWMYQHLNSKTLGKHIKKLPQLKKAIKDQDKNEIINNLHNDFEPLAVKTFPELDIIKKNLAKYGCQNSILLGSGLGMAGFFEYKKTRDNAYQKLKNQYKTIFSTHTL